MRYQEKKDLAFATFDRVKAESPGRVSRIVCLDTLFKEVANAETEMSVVLASSLFDHWCHKNGMTLWPDVSNW